MKPLIVLLVTFLVATITLKSTAGEPQYAFAGRIALSVMLIFTAVAHFAFTKGMTMMLPQWLPYKKGMVYFTGIIEVMAAFGLLIPHTQVLTGWMLILFFILLLPANIYAAVKKVDYQKGTYEGSGVRYLWFRVPLQVLFIVWTYVCAIR